VTGGTSLSDLPPLDTWLREPGLKCYVGTSIVILSSRVPRDRSGRFSAEEYSDLHLSQEVDNVRGEILLDWILDTDQLFVAVPESSVMVTRVSPTSLDGSHLSSLRILRIYQQLRTQHSLSLCQRLPRIPIFIIRLR
jgi:hypothetical protein